MSQQGITGGTGGNTFNIYELGSLEGVYTVDGQVYSGDTKLDSLSKSEQEKLLVNLLAGSPMLFGPNFSNQIGQQTIEEQNVALQIKIENAKNDVISQMLDAWSDNIQEQIKADKEYREKQQIINDQKAYQEQQKDNVQSYITWLDTRSIELQATPRDAGTYQEYLRSLTVPQRIEEVQNTSNLIVDNYFHRAGAANIEDTALARNVLSAALMQALVIMPLAQQIVLQPIEANQLSNQVGVNPISDQNLSQLPPILQAQMLPVINFFVLDMIKDVSIMLYLKQKDNGAKPPTIDFANEFAAQVLAKIGNSEALAHLIQTRIPGAQNFTAEQLADAVVYAKLFALANAIALFIHVEGGTLQESELRDLLNGVGVPDDKRKELLQAMRSVLDTLPPDKRVDFSETLLKYVASMPDPGDLTSMWQALSGAMEEISSGVRAVNQPLQ